MSILAVTPARMFPLLPGFRDVSEDPMYSKSHPQPCTHRPVILGLCARDAGHVFQVYNGMSWYILVQCVQMNARVKIQSLSSELQINVVAVDIMTWEAHRPNDWKTPTRSQNGPNEAEHGMSV